MKPLVPPRLARRPVDARGFPIPFVQFVRADGKADFRILDHGKTEHCLRLRLCALCGEPLGAHVFFVGGDGCFQFGQFTDPPMHRDCALFALLTCPHLATAKGRYAPLANLPDEPGLKVVLHDVSPVKADRFALMHGKRYTYAFERGRGMIVRAVLPWIDVRWFRDGAEIEP
jgi:hypothetical protein